MEKQTIKPTDRQTKYVFRKVENSLFSWISQQLSVGEDWNGFKSKQ